LDDQHVNIIWTEFYKVDSQNHHFNSVKVGIYTGNVYVVLLIFGKNRELLGFSQEIYRTILLDLTKTFEKLKSDFELNLENALKLWGKH